MGEKDKGIPVIDNAGNKLFEVEKEELIMTLELTEKVEDLVYKYQQTPDDSILVELGKLLSEEILRNTQDNSEKFKTETAS